MKKSELVLADSNALAHLGQLAFAHAVFAALMIVTLGTSVG